MICRRIVSWRKALAGGLVLAALAGGQPAAGQGYYCPPGYSLVPAYDYPGYACVPDDYLYPQPDYAYPPFVGSVFFFDRFHRLHRFDRFHGNGVGVRNFGAPGRFRR
jgi:hypothetical protein